MALQVGQLFIVATPIGNLADMSPRAVEVLQRADLVLAEDTRHSGSLFKHFNIRSPLRSWHAHNENSQLQMVLERLQSGENIALISDAGTPLISDPGYGLVEACRAAGIKVTPIPGPCALIAALSVSGLPTERFSFEGFLPAKSKARQTRLASLAQETRTLVFYEAPHRLAAMLADAQAQWGAERQTCLVRELTKRYESVYSGRLEDMAAWAAGDGPDRRGEFVVLFAPAPAAKAVGMSAELRELAMSLHGSMPPRRLAKALARFADCPTAEVYDYLLSLDAGGQG